MLVYASRREMSARHRAVLFHQRMERRYARDQQTEARLRAPPRMRKPRVAVGVRVEGGGGVRGGRVGAVGSCIGEFRLQVRWRDSAECRDAYYST